MELKRIKNSYLYHVLMWQLTWCGQKLRRHMAAYEHATWHIHMCARGHVYMCVRLCVISEIKHPIQDLSLLTNYAHLINLSDFNYFCHVGLFFSIFMCMVCGDMWSV